MNATPHRVARFLAWHRRCLDEYDPVNPPLWPIIWQIPADAGNLRLIGEVVLLLVVFLVYATIFVLLPLYGLVWLMLG